MQKFASITATAQGYVAYDLNGQAVMFKYDKLVQNKNTRSNRVKVTQEEIEKIHLNMVQRSMYRRLMYGLKEYAPEQVASFSPSTLSKIVDDYKKAKQYLHILKSKKLFSPETMLMNALFPHAKIGEKDFDWFLDLPKTATLRNLGITTRDVIDEFIRRKLLPKNFYELQTQIQLP
jgi:urease gamma subunit